MIMNARSSILFPTLLVFAAAACGGDDGSATGTTDSAADDSTTASTLDDASVTLTQGDDTSSSGATSSNTAGSSESSGAAEDSSGGSGGSSSDSAGSSSGSAGESSGDASGSSSGAGESSSSASGAESSSDGAMVGDDTIYDIQNGTIPADTAVNVEGVIVTAVAGNAIFVQEPGGGEYSGVYVFVMAAPAVSVGDEVDIAGVTAEFNSLTEINASMGSVTPTGASGLDLDAEVVDAGDLGEPWESVLVRVEGAALDVTALPVADEFVVDADGVSVRVDDFLFSPFDDAVTFADFGIGASFTAIQGPLNYFAGDYKIATRDANDLEGYVAPVVVGFPVDDLLPGDLVVTEVMVNPTCANDNCEWIEIYNNTDVDLDLQGLIIHDDAGNEGTLDASVMVPSFGYTVVASHDMVTWPYAFAAGGYFGTQPALGNGGDQVVLLNASGVIDETAPWGAGAQSGRAWRLDPLVLDAVGNDNAASWCYSNTPLVDANVMNEFGTPFAANGSECN